MIGIDVGEGALACGRFIFGVVLRIPCHGRFMWPLAVAGLGLRYLSISSTEMLGHPFKKPFLVALSSLDILGLHNDWWANLTLSARVEMEWTKLAASCAVGVGSTRLFIFGDGCLSEGIGSVHKSLLGSLKTLRITFLLYITSQCSLQKCTVHPASHSTLTPISEAMVRLGTICPVRTVGNPGIFMSQQCVDFTLVPSGRFMVRGCEAIRLLSTGVPSMMKIAVAPVSTIALDIFVGWANVLVSARAATAGKLLRDGVLLDVLMVTSSSS